MTALPTSADQAVKVTARRTLFPSDDRSKAMRIRINGRVTIEDRGHTSHCWTWRLTLNRKGYGLINDGGKIRSVHRVSYEAFVGPIPEGLQIDHLCRVRSCCNPDHLEPVTAAENYRRMPDELKNFGSHRTGASNPSRKGTHCRRGHEFTPENTYSYASGRTCKECKRAVWQRKKAKLLLKAEV